MNLSRAVLSIVISKYQKFPIPNGGYFIQKYRGDKDLVDINNGPWDVCLGYIIKKDDKVIKKVNLNVIRHEFNRLKIDEPEGDIYVLYLTLDIPIRNKIMEKVFKAVERGDVRSHKINNPLHLLYDRPIGFHTKVQADRDFSDRGYYGINKEDLDKIFRCEYYHKDFRLTTLHHYWIKSRIKEDRGIYYLPFPLLNPDGVKVKMYDWKNNDITCDITLYKYSLPQFRFEKEVALTYLFTTKETIVNYNPDNPDNPDTLGVQSILIPISKPTVRLSILPVDIRGKADTSILKIVRASIFGYEYNLPSKEEHEVLGENQDVLSLVFHPLSVSLLYKPDNFGIDFQADYFGGVDNAEVKLDVVWKGVGRIYIYHEIVDKYSFDTTR